MTEPSGPLLQRELPRNNLELLGITLEHAGAVEILPPHHKDPFDRILIAQAIGERVPIVSIDAQLDPYGITRIW